MLSSIAVGASCASCMPEQPTRGSRTDRGLRAIKSIHSRHGRNRFIFIHWGHCDIGEVQFEFDVIDLARLGLQGMPMPFDPALRRKPLRNQREAADGSRG
jgi:hypothetical protein